MGTFHRTSFTLVEIVITLVISTAIVLGVMALMNFSTVQTNIQSYALTQNVELTYAERFIKNKVSNAEFISLEGTLDESNRATGIIIKPWVSSGKPESKIVYSDADHTLYFYPNKAATTKTVISHNTAALFYNSKDPAKTANFKLLSYTLTQSKPSNSTLANIVLTGSVYAKLGSKTIGYVFNVNKRRYYPTIQRGVDDADPGNELRCMGNVGAYFNGIFDEHAIIDKSLIIKGGYSQDFNNQDICATPTTLQRSVPGSAPLDVMTLAVAPGDLVTLDGFVFRQANPINGRGSLSLSQSKFYGSAGMVALLGGTLSISRVYFTGMHPWTEGTDIHRKIIDFTNRDSFGVYYTPSSVTIDRLIIENNGPSVSYHKSTFGYGILIGGQPSSFTLTNSKFTNNYLMDNLIEVCSTHRRAQTVTINNCSFTNNKSSGSLVYVAGDNVTIENSSIASNTLPIEVTSPNAEIAANNARAAVDVDSAFTTIISNCKMNNNSIVARFASILHLSLATQLWPIPSANYLQVTLNGNQFLDNDIIAENGAQGHYAGGHIGGIVDAGYSRVSMNNCDVQRNDTSTVLLGLYGDKTYGNPTLIIRNSNISNNNINTYKFSPLPHSSSGGVFYAWDLGTIDLKNVLVTNNQIGAPDLGTQDAGIFFWGNYFTCSTGCCSRRPRVDIENVTFAGNSLHHGLIMGARIAQFFGGRTSGCQSMTTNIINTIFDTFTVTYDNPYPPPWCMTQISASKGTYSFFHDYCSEPAVATNIVQTAPPGFVSGSYTLDAASPCVDAGQPATRYDDPNDDGNAIAPAKGTKKNDMGAYGGPGAALGMGAPAGIGYVEPNFYLCL